MLDEIYLPDYVRRAVIYGDISTLDLLYTMFPLLTETINVIACLMAVKKGVFVILHYLFWDRKLRRQDFGKHVLNIVSEAACHNQIEALKFIHERWSLTTEEIKSRNNYLLYEIMMARVSVDTLKFIHETWGYTKEDLHSRNNFVIQECVFHCRVDVLEFLHETWGLTPDDVRMHNNFGIRQAAEDGNLAMLVFLVQTWNLTIEDARVNNNQPLRRAATRGHLNILSFLHGTMRLTADDARANNNEALRNAARYGRVDILNFLFVTWNLTVQDARSCDNEIIKIATESKVLAFLKETWGIVPSDLDIGNCVRTEQEERRLIYEEFTASYPSVKELVIDSCAICLEELKTFNYWNINKIRCGHVFTLHAFRK